MEIPLYNKPAPDDERMLIGVRVLAPALKQNVKMWVTYRVANLGPWGLLNLIVREAEKGFERAA